MKTIFFFLLITLLSCSKSEIVESNNLIVSDRTTYNISGKIVWSGDTTQGVGFVTLNLTGPENQSVITSAAGLYSFSISTSGNYTITPTKSVNLLNGVTGIGGDATLIQQYIAGVASLNSFQIIAADANKSNTITMADATIINQAVLGNLAAQNILKPSWTFVDRVYVFGIIPPIPNYPKTISVTVSSDVSQLDFVGIKRGDVNNSCNPDN